MLTETFFKKIENRLQNLFQSCTCNYSFQLEMRCSVNMHRWMATAEREVNSYPFSIIVWHHRLRTDPPV